MCGLTNVIFGEQSVVMLSILIKTAEWHISRVGFTNILKFYWETKVFKKNPKMRPQQFWLSEVRVIEVRQ